MKEARTPYEKGEPVPLRTLLPQVYTVKQWKRPWLVVRLTQQWPAVVGAETARLTMPAFLRRDTLWIYVQDSSWMHHLHFIKTDLLARINQYAPEMEITDIRWQLRSDWPTAPAEQSPLQPQALDSDLEQRISRLTAGIADQKCRQALQRLWRTFAADSR
ncbi:MAG: DUF721 domain-containing protein [Desulfobulbus sp.]|nr:DUF721 domain-containing protein [Desulfobulbus sp.]